MATSADASFVVDVKWDGGANGQRIFEFSNPNGNVCWFSPSDQGKLSFGIKINGVEQVLADDPLPIGVWKTVAVMIYQDTAYLEVDGVELAETALSPMTLETCAPPPAILEEDVMADFSTGVWTIFPLGPGR